MRDLQPPHSSPFATVAEEANATARDSIVGPEIHQLVLRAYGEITSLYVHPDAV
jgi:hypothetical protein